MGDSQQDDGSPQPQLRTWDALTRTLMLADVQAADGTVHRYGALVDFFGEDEVTIYRDGAQEAVVALPATYPVPGGHLEIAMSLYGLKRAHVVLDDGSASTMRPARNSGEWWRARLAHRHPGFSRLVGAVAIVVLLVGVALAVPQALELVTGLDLVADHVGTFTSPVALPAWANTTLLVGGIVASIERALTLRNHWLIDVDTWLLGD